MKKLGIMLALGGLLALPALGDEPGGISGTVVDIATGQPIPHATLYYYRSPYSESGANHIVKLVTNAHGAFSTIGLDPGRYVLMARVPNRVEGCALDDVMGGEVARVRIEIGHDTVMCSGPRVHPALVDPNAVGDVYRI